MKMRIITRLLPVLLICHSANGTPLLGGRFETTNDVTGFLNLALDVAEIQASNDLSEMTDIYKRGRNAYLVDIKGQQIQISLASLSLNSTNEMIQDPMFNIFRHYFEILGGNSGEEEGRFSGHPVQHYADAVVSDLFDINALDIGLEAALTISLWMAVAHELNEVVRACQSQNTETGLGAIDRVAALWIGALQQEGSNEQGHLLYKLAEIAGERFGQDEGETWVNTRVIDILNSLQGNLSSDMICSQESGNSVVRDDVHNLIGLMTVPLIQNLIHHTVNVENESGPNYVELYGLSVFPRLEACDPNVHGSDLNLYSLKSFDISQRLQSITMLQAFFGCLKVSCADVGSYLGGVVPQCEDNAAGVTSTSLSYIDRDFLQLEIFLKYQAYGAALDIYRFGYNSIHSLQALALNTIIPESPASQFDIFKDYYETTAFDFADTKIISALQLEAPFEDASPEQISEFIIGLLNSEVLYLSIVSSVQFAIQECWNQNTSSALQYLDISSAFYIGSIEGGSRGGQDRGQLLFAVSKQLCSKFGTCVGEGSDTNSMVNEVIIDALLSSVNAVANQDCQSAEDSIKTTIIPALQITLIQGMLAPVSVNEAQPSILRDRKLAVSYAFSQGLLPLVHASNEESAELIEQNIRGQFNETALVDGFLVAVDALRSALPGMHIECLDIGTLNRETSISLCSSTLGGATSNPDSTMSPGQYSLPSVPIQPEATQLAFGRYIFASETIGESDSSFALDVRDIARAETASDARRIYDDGLNAVSSMFSDDRATVSLASFSTDATIYMSQDPMFSIFKFALYDDKSFDNPIENGFVYADEVVREVLNTGDTELAAEAVVVLNVWMVIAHKLYKAVRNCEQGLNAEFEIDSAVALWIGKEQTEGRYDSGWMLYSVGQTGAMHFGHDEGEAAVNSKLMHQFNEMQGIAGTCSEDPVAHLELRLLLSAVLRSLSIPLVQHLLFRIAVDYRWHVELYAIAVISQCSACHLPAYMVLSDTLYTGFKKDQVSDDVLDNLAIFLQCLRISCDDLDSTDNAHPDLQTLVGEICQRLNENGDHSKIVDYVSSTDVQEQLRIDLDVLQIGIFARVEAYQAALDYYTYGQNSVKRLSGQNGDVVYSLLSLQSLSKLPTRSDDSEFGLFSQYFGSESYAHDIIMDALIQDGPSKDASRGQVAELVSSTLQTMVSYMAVLSKFQDAINSCKVANQADAEAEWDEGVAFFVGSIETNTPLLSNGVLMYSLGLEQCRHFDTCDESGEAISNVELFKHFANGMSMIKERECGQAESLLSLYITKLMRIPLVQGTLYHSIESSLLDDTRAENAMATGYIMANSIEPVVSAANATSARIIADNFKFPVEGSAPLPNLHESVFDGFRYAVSEMGIDCNDVGHTLLRHELLSVCENGASNGMLSNLGDGIYIATTFVQDTASIARDLAEMERALSSGQPNLAKLIYSEGKNSQIFDENGKFLKLRSLRGLSTDATLEMLDEPLFNIFLYAQQSESSIATTKNIPLILGDVDGGRVFADNFVQKAFQATSESSRSLAAEASVALNVWMYLSHILHMTLESCRGGAFSGTDGVHAIDESAALWIGNDQIDRDGQGYLLYALAEEMGEHFNIGKTGQAEANTVMLKLLNEARDELSAPNACSDTSSTFTRLHVIVNNIISQMIIPLVQGLIHNIQMNDQDRMELYAQAFVPLVAGCSPETFEFLNENLIRAKYSVAGSDAIIKRIRSTFQCLGIRCEDVGFHYSEQVAGGSKIPTCMDYSAAMQPLAGYRPTHDVLQYTLLDLDMLEMDILMQMNAYKAAERVYLYGKHARSNGDGRGQILSIAHLAVESQRLLGRYYQSEKYGDTIIREALTGLSNLSGVPSQRKALVIRSCQVLVMHFSALQSLIDSLSHCSATAASDVTASLDKAAAFLIGYLEGSEDGGSGYGYLHYDLAEEYCQEFGTCTVNGTAVNDQWISLLYSARGAAMSMSCDALRKETKQIESILMVPVIQATISAAVRLSAPGYTDQDEAEAFIFSRALLPLVEKVDPSASEFIGAALHLDGRPASKMIGREVISILAGVYDELGIDCKLIGKTGTYDACEAYDSTSTVPTAEDARSYKYTFLWVIIGVFVSLSMFLVFRYIYLKKEKSTKIAPNNGEINYTTKSLLSRDKFQDNCKKVSAEVESLMTSSSSSMCVYPGDVESSGIFSQGNDDYAADAETWVICNTVVRVEDAEII